MWSPELVELRCNDLALGIAAPIGSLVGAAVGVQSTMRLTAIPMIAALLFFMNARSSIKREWLVH